jgi:uncharacterized protein HemX
MRLWQAAPLVILLISLPVLSACDFLGLGGSKKTQEQEAYEKQVKALQEQQEANERYQQEQQQYYEQIQKALEEYYKQYNEYQQQQIQQVPGGATSNQTVTSTVTDTMPPPQTLTVTSTPGS